MTTFWVTLALLAFFILPSITKIKKAMAVDTGSDDDTPLPVNEPYADEQSASQEYFTYETIESDPKPAHATVMQPIQNGIDDDARPAFDLRQAVVYQTILNNDYISEIK
ncbi:MAG: hypothetical protein K5650_04145 [Bacteroidales bacterium]|nr:hypothetical protein [Bacteroidales bacterium]